jgi:hypothetical protein
MFQNDYCAIEETMFKYNLDHARGRKQISQGNVTKSNMFNYP